MRRNYTFWRGSKSARVEFRDGRASRVLAGVKKLIHKGGFVTLETRHELYHWHESEVRLVHVYSSVARPAVKKEASF